MLESLIKGSTIVVLKQITNKNKNKSSHCFVTLSYIFTQTYKLFCSKKNDQILISTLEVKTFDKYKIHQHFYTEN